MIVKCGACDFTGENAVSHWVANHAALPAAPDASGVVCGCCDFTGPGTAVVRHWIESHTVKAA